jgi:hypothetical protein
MANALRKDRYTPTVFQEEMAKLDIKDNGSYTWLPNGCQMVANRLPQDRLGKDSIGKDSKKSNKVARVYFENEEVNNTFLDYMEMRKKIKAPMTDRAIQLAINKLNKLSGGDNDKAIKILEQSIMNSWKGLFELKEEKKANKFNNFEGRSYNNDQLEKMLGVNK